MAIRVTTGTYDPHMNMPTQGRGYSCSAATASWMIRSLGEDRCEDEVADIMVANGRLLTTDGLANGDGSGLAAQLRELGYAAYNIGSASWEDFTSRAGNEPLGIGSRGAYHWMGVRSFDPAADRLLLANSARSYTLEKFGFADYLTRQQFEQFGSNALVGITIGRPVSQSDSELKERLADLQAQAEGQRVVIDHLTGRVAGALEQVRGAMTIHDRAAVDELADIVHRTYRELGNVKDELARHHDSA